MHVFHIHLCGKYQELRNNSFHIKHLNLCLISLIIFQGEVLINDLTITFVISQFDKSTHLVASPSVITSFIFHDFHLVSRYRVEEIKRSIIYVVIFSKIWPIYCLV